MQQYFANVPLAAGKPYFFTKEQAHHASDVVRLHEETVRLVYEGKAWFARTARVDGKFAAIVEKEDPQIHECACEMTLCMALIRREKFELVLQKASEIGFSRVVPFVSSRCVVREKQDKKERVAARWQTILLEGAQQCKRNIVPELAETIPFDHLDRVQAELKAAAYENAYSTSARLSHLYHGQKSAAVVIGPEGGFSPDEVQWLVDHGYQAVTLGSRILRAETAAIYAGSVLSEAAGDQNEVFSM